MGSKAGIRRTLPLPLSHPMPHFQDSLEGNMLLLIGRWTYLHLTETFGLQRDFNAG